MKQRLGQIALVVDDYDKALDFYTKKLHFKLIEDTPLSETKRWVVVEPPGGESGARLLLAKADTDEQRSRVGNQTGGRVFLFLYTENCLKDHAHLVEQGVTIVRGPDTTPYGTVLVFKDIYGNQWDLIERNK
jgi:catechol 2,3-dioxygenase-like lactoylglutathione lyase family enzyme